MSQEEEDLLKKISIIITENLCSLEQEIVSSVKENTREFVLRTLGVYVRDNEWVFSRNSLLGETIKTLFLNAVKKHASEIVTKFFEERSSEEMTKLRKAIRETYADIYQRELDNEVRNLAYEMNLQIVNDIKVDLQKNFSSMPNFLAESIKERNINDILENIKNEHLKKFFEEDKKSNV